MRVEAKYSDDMVIEYKDSDVSDEDRDERGRWTSGGGPDLAAWGVKPGQEWRISDKSQQLVKVSQDWERTRPWAMSRDDLAGRGGGPRPDGLRYDAKLPSEARNQIDGIHVGPKFFDLPSDEDRRFALYHELGHELADAASRDGTAWDLDYNNGKTGDGLFYTYDNGSHEEMLADAYAHLATGTGVALPAGLADHVADRATRMGLPMPGQKEVKALLTVNQAVAANRSGGKLIPQDGTPVTAVPSVVTSKLDYNARAAATGAPAEVHGPLATTRVHTAFGSYVKCTVDGWDVDPATIRTQPEQSEPRPAQAPQVKADGQPRDERGRWADGDSDADGNTVTIYDPAEIGFLPSRDHAGQIGDLRFRPGGESDRRVQAIRQSIRAEGGLREPIRVGGADGYRYLADGHHRYVAARDEGIPVPVVGMYEPLKGGMTKARLAVGQPVEGTLAIRDPHRAAAALAEGHDVTVPTAAHAELVRRILASKPGEVASKPGEVASKEWDEDQHPRDDHGRFGSGGGGGTAVLDRPRTAGDVIGQVADRHGMSGDEIRKDPAYQAGRSAASWGTTIQGTMTDMRSERDRISQALTERGSWLPRQDQMNAAGRLAVHDEVISHIESANPALAATLADDDSIRAFASGLTGKFGGLSADLQGVDHQGGLITGGKVYDGQGQQVGVWNVTFNPRAEQLWWGMLKLQPTAQGSGFGRAFLANMETKARQAGFKSIGMEADIDVGGYTWAALGFTGRINGDIYNRLYRWTSAQEPVDDRGDSFAQGRPDLFDDDLRGQAQAMIARPEGLDKRDRWENPTTVQDVMMLGMDDKHTWTTSEGQRMWPGKAVLLGTAWYGAKPL